MSRNILRCASPAQLSIAGIIERLATGPVRFLGAYAVLLLMGTLDVLITSLALYLGGNEINQFALWVLDGFGPAGLTILKFAAIGVAMVVCETIGESAPGAARALAWSAVGMNFIPVLVGGSGLVGYFCEFDLDLAQRSVAALDEDIMVI